MPTALALSLAPAVNGVLSAWMQSAASSAAQAAPGMAAGHAQGRGKKAAKAKTSTCQRNPANATVVNRS